MEKQELYHFHKEGKHDREWQERKTIVVPDNFKSTTYQRFLDFSNSVEIPNEGFYNYYQIVEDFLREGITDPNAMLNLLIMGHDISFRSNEFKRENALENYRLAKKSDLPSRLHSIYLTDEDGIDAWKNKFGNANLTLYRVEVEGKIFKTNEQLIPDERLSYSGVYDAAYNYWNPNFKKVPKDSNEYLAQGKIKVLEKIKSF